MAAALAYVILGRAEAADAARELLSFSGALPSLQPEFYAELAQLQLLRGAQGLQPTVALLPFDDEQMLLMYCQPVDGGALEHHVFLPRAAAPQAAVLPDWLTHLPPAPSDHDMTIMALPIPVVPAPSAAMRQENLAWLLAQMPGGDFEAALRLLRLLIGGDLRIANYPTDFQQRLSLLAGLQALLPSPLGATVSFATAQPLACQRALQLQFADDEIDDTSIDWHQLADAPPAASHSHIALPARIVAGRRGAAGARHPAA